ncbi:MAG: type II toxin-antitoxin system PemK/MazF family toxin, partial [Deltaproteobacteria bacterium]|nr:type II toxin-antitoxin system PemK/MazF family toxin [Deltaproteobacteria bacterium]
EITSQGKGYPTQIAIGQSANLRKPSFVSCECLHTLPKERLLRYLGELPHDLMQKVNQAIIFALQLTE